MLISRPLRNHVPCRPYSTSDKDIIEFFSEYNVIEVAFVYEPDGRPSGLVSLVDFAPARPLSGPAAPDADFSARSRRVHAWCGPPHSISHQLRKLTTWITPTAVLLLYPPTGICRVCHARGCT